MKYLLEDVARAMKVHPRTVLRALEGKEGAYWKPGYNPDISIRHLAEKLDVSLRSISRIVNVQDEALSAEQAADFLGMPGRTFRHRHYRPLVARKNFVRYSREDLSREHVERYI